MNELFQLGNKCRYQHVMGPKNCCSFLVEPISCFFNFLKIIGILRTPSFSARVGCNVQL